MNSLLNRSTFFIFWISLLFLLFFQDQAPGAEEKLPEIKSGKVTLTWQELKTILDELEGLKKDIAEKEEKEKDKLPVDYTLYEAKLHGIVKGKSARFDAKVTVEVLKEGWVEIYFFSKDVAIESVSITPKGQGIARFVHDDKGYRLIAEGPDFFTINMGVQIPVESNDLRYTLSFVPPKAVINLVKAEILEKGVHIIQSDPPGEIIQHDEGVIFNAVLNDDNRFRLSWKIEKDIGISRKSVSEILSLASFDKSTVTVFSQVTLKHAPSFQEIGFFLPRDVEIITVTSPDIERWSINNTQQGQIVKLEGSIDPRRSVKIALSYRVSMPDLPAQLSVPTPNVTGVDNLEGYLGVEVMGNLEVTADKVKRGMLIPARNLPKKLWKDVSSPILYGYEYQTDSFSPSFRVRRYQEIQTVIANVDMVDCVTHRTLEGKSITRVMYLIRNNDRQFLTLTLPENSRIWQAFLNSVPVKPAQNESGKILIPMKKSAAQGQELQSFSIEIGYITEVSKLSLKGDILNQLPTIDIPINYLRWCLYLPEYYEYSRFEGPLKQVAAFSNTGDILAASKTQIDIPTQGKSFLFEKYLLVDERPYVRGKYGQYLGDDIFLTLTPSFTKQPYQVDKETLGKGLKQQRQVIPQF